MQWGVGHCSLQARLATLWEWQVKDMENWKDACGKKSKMCKSTRKTVEARLHTRNGVSGIAPSKRNLPPSREWQVEGRNNWKNVCIKNGRGRGSKDDPTESEICTRSVLRPSRNYIESCRVPIPKP
jgi:hypothetical protein